MWERCFSSKTCLLLLINCHSQVPRQLTEAQFTSRHFVSPRGADYLFKVPFARGATSLPEALLSLKILICLSVHLISGVVVELLPLPRYKQWKRGLPQNSMLFSFNEGVFLSFDQGDLTCSSSAQWPSRVIITSLGEEVLISLVSFFEAHQDLSSRLLMLLGVSQFFKVFYYASSLLHYIHSESQNLVNTHFAPPF